MKEGGGGVGGRSLHNSPVIVGQYTAMGWHQLYVRIQLEEQPIGKQAVDAVLIESEQPTIKGCCKEFRPK